MAPILDGKFKATSREKLAVVLGVGEAAIYAIIRYAFVAASEKQPTLEREVARTIIRTRLDRFNAAQIQWVLMSSSVAYKDWIVKRAKKEDALPEIFTEPLSNEGAKIHWIGDKDAKKVLLHYHGGGFVMPLHKGHMSMINYFRREIKRRSGVEVKLAFLEYTLTPFATYPTQYRQAVLALQHILDSGISPADIFISGDSAGGLLAFQIISHILHPHPSLPPMSIPTVPFAGVLAMSCWVVFDSHAESFVRNDKDAVSPAPFLSWGRMVCEGTVLADNTDEPGGYWSEPLKAPPEWWQNTEKVTKHILFTYGEWEGFRDDIKAFVGKLKEGVSGSKVEVTALEEPRGVHVGPTIDAFRNWAPSALTKSMAEWVYDHVIG